MARKIYLAGPMTGMPDSNYPAFHRTAADLRALGFEVLNPAENPEPACGKWEGYMRMAISQLVQCDTVALLYGWQNSKGACIEYWLAWTLGLSIVMAELVEDSDLTAVAWKNPNVNKQDVELAQTRFQEWLDEMVRGVTA
jgi:nucleoside 2-deoxyribosyltransferase